LLHERVHEQEAETRGDLRIVRGLRLRSLRLGLIGVADVVEFHAGGSGIELAGLPGRWAPMPVEYKRGRPKPDICDEVQLCAQAMCLEEMTGCAIEQGALFYGMPRRRTAVALDAALRAETERTAERLRELLRRGITPPAVYEKKCDNCSLLRACMPKTAGRGKSPVPGLSSLVPTPKTLAANP
jgi:CRISPR-associated exonuclease Cas4